MSNKSVWSRLPLHLFLTAAVGLIAYSNSFHAPFIFDDEGSITANNVIKNLHRFLYDDGYLYNPRRFLGYLTVALNYRFGALDVTGYHVVNLAIHIGTGMLTYLLARLTLSTPTLRRDDEGARGSWFIPLFAALLFVAHPLQTQAVTYIIQRLASLATLFFVASLTCYAKARLLQEESGRPFACKPVCLYLLALAAAGCAMKTKEIAFTLPFVVVLYEFLFFRMTAAKKVLFLLPVALTVLIVPLSLLGANKPIGQLISDVTAVTRVDSELSRLDYLFTQFPVIATYLRLLVLPVRQNLDYDFPVYHSLASMPVLFSLLLLLALFGGALFLWYRSSDTRTAPQVRLIAFGILWFFITISVESSIIPIADVIFEHRVYLPSVGAFIALAAVFSLLFKGALSRTALATAGVVVLALTATTFARNQVWGSELSLWGDAVQKSPQKARPHYNLALALEKSGRLDESLQQALIATRLSPKEASPYNLIGSIFGKKGDYDKAIAALSQAVKLDPTLAEAQVNLGDAYRLKRMLPQAMEQYQAAMKQRPTDASIYHKIGVTFALQQNLPKAAVFFQCAASLDPSTPQYRLDLMRAQAGAQAK